VAVDEWNEMVTTSDVVCGTPKTWIFSLRIRSTLKVSSPVATFVPSEREHAMYSARVISALCPGCSSAHCFAHCPFSSSRRIRVMKTPAPSPGRAAPTVVVWPPPQPAARTVSKTAAAEARIAFTITG
jgi:hypothetical protein